MAIPISVRHALMRLRHTFFHAKLVKLRELREGARFADVSTLKVLPSRPVSSSNPVHSTDRSGHYRTFGEEELKTS
jgi:hypothetical protein